VSAAVRYTEVAVTLPVAGRYHYRVPGHLAARTQVGARVLVPFGPRKVTGVVVRAESPLPAGIEAVEVSEVLDGDACPANCSTILL
jgi:primosomal protein N' (replication factor Y)